MNTKVYTFDGGLISPFNPIPEQILFSDIARGLAHRCRWGGQIREYYSVAEHSIMVACQCSDEYRLWGLLHDAAEAYIGDIPAPLKDKVWFHVPDEQGVIQKLPYSDVEDRILHMVLAEAGCSVVAMPDVVHEADMIIRRWEYRELLDPGTRHNSTFVPMTPTEAMARWLESFHSLQREAQAAA